MRLTDLVYWTVELIVIWNSSPLLHLSNNWSIYKLGNLQLFCGNFAFPILECLDFHTENTSAYFQHVFQKINIIIVCFKATFLLCYKISSNRDTAKQQPTKGSNFLCSPHGISVALNIKIVFTIKEHTSKLELNKCTNWWSYSRFSCFSQWGERFKQYRNQHIFAFFAVGLPSSYSWLLLNV